jgi:hypothetical protein
LNGQERELNSPSNFTGVIVDLSMHVFCSDSNHLISIQFNQQTINSPYTILPIFHVQGCPTELVKGTKRLHYQPLNTVKTVGMTIHLELHLTGCLKTKLHTHARSVNELLTHLLELRLMSHGIYNNFEYLGTRIRVHNFFLGSSICPATNSRNVNILSEVLKFSGAISRINAEPKTNVLEIS